MNLTDELTKKQALRFQLNELNVVFIQNTLSKNSEGIFNLNSNLDENSRRRIMEYLKLNYNYGFELNHTLSNYEIMFRKKGEIKNA